MRARAVAAVAGAAVLFWLPFLLGLPLTWATTNPAQADFVPGALEVLVLSGATALGLTLVPMAAIRLPTRPPNLRRARGSRLWGLAAGHVLLVLLVGIFVTQWAPLTDDEEAYRLQARLLLRGVWSEPAFPLREGVPNPFVIDVVGADPPHWTGCYPLVAAVLTAVGSPLGFDALGWVGLGGLLIVQIGRLAEELWPDADGELAAALVATSPVVLMLGAHKHTSMAATLFAVVAVRLAVAVLAASPNESPRGRYPPGYLPPGMPQTPASTSTARPWAPLVLGVVLALGVLTRPLDGGLTILLVAGTFLVRLPRDRWMVVAGAVGLGAAPFAVLFFAHNQAITGHFNRMPYDLISDFPIYGFGETAFGRHTPLTAVFKTATVLFRMQLWTLGWPWLALAPSAYAALRGERGPAAVLALAAGLHLVLYAAAPFGAVATTGTTYHVWLVPIGVLLLAGGLRHREARPAVVALTTWAWLTFVPYAAWNVHRADQAALAPRRAAQELVAAHGPVVVLLSSRHNFPPLTYVFYGPVPTGHDDPVLWFGGDTDVAEVSRRWPDRPIFRMAPRADGTVAVERGDVPLF